MHILLTGGTGLIGRRLCHALLADGHQLTVLSRQSVERVRAICGQPVQVWRTMRDWLDDDCVDAVINLAGEPIADQRWTTNRKQQLRDSRILLTQQLVTRLLQLEHRPAVLMSGSAIGYYGNRGQVWCQETMSRGRDFAAQLCADWEAATELAERAGVRVIKLRTGLVLDAKGGLIRQLRLPFSVGFGARLGEGSQWMSWIHWMDYRNLVLRLLSDPEARGAFNLVAPSPVTNGDFTRQFARALHRPSFAVAPALVLRLLLGERAQLLLASQRVRPQRALDHEYRFQFPTLLLALTDILSDSQ